MLRHASVLPDFLSPAELENLLMMTIDPDDVAADLDCYRRLGWPLPATLRASVVALLQRRGWTVGDPQVPADVLSLALLVSSLPHARSFH